MKPQTRYEHNIYQVSCTWYLEPGTYDMSSYATYHAPVCFIDCAGLAPNGLLIALFIERGRPKRKKIGYQQHFIVKPSASAHKPCIVCGCVLSNGRGIKKGTQGSLLAWRTASLLLVRLLFVLKPHMRDDGRLQSEPKLQSEPMGA